MPNKSNKSISNKLSINYSVWDPNEDGVNSSGPFPIGRATNPADAGSYDYFGSKISYWNTWGGSWFPTDVLRLYYEKDKTTEDANIYNIIYFAKFVGESSGYLPIPGFFNDGLNIDGTANVLSGCYSFSRYPYGRPDAYASNDEVDETKWIQYYNGLKFNSSSANSLPSLGQLSAAFYNFYLGVFSITQIRQMWYSNADITGNFGGANALVKVRVAYKCDPPYFKNGENNADGETPYWVDTLYYYTIDEKYYYDSDLYATDPSIPNPVQIGGAEQTGALRFANAMTNTSNIAYLANFIVNYTGVNSITGFVEDFDPDYWTTSGESYLYNLTTTDFFFRSRDDGTPGGGKCQIACPYSGNISFDWRFNTADTGGAYWDPFTFFINSEYYELSNASVGQWVEQSGSKTYYVNKGDLIGFEANAIDGILGFGNANITGFTFDIDLIKTTIAGIDPVYPTPNIYEQSNIILNLNTKYIPGGSGVPASIPKTVKFKIEVLTADDVGDNGGTVHYQVSFVDQPSNILANIANNSNLAVEFSFNSFTIDPVSDNLKGYIYLNKNSGLLNPSNILDANDDPMYFNLESYYTSINAVIYNSYSNKILSDVSNSSITGIPYTDINNQIKLYDESENISYSSYSLIKNKNKNKYKSIGNKFKTVGSSPTFDFAIKLYRLPQLPDTTAVFEGTYLDIISMSNDYTYESSADYSEEFEGNIMFFYRTHDSLSNMDSNVLLLTGDLNANMVTQIDYTYMSGSEELTFSDVVPMKQENPGLYYIDYAYPREENVMQSTDLIKKVEVNVYSTYTYEEDGDEITATRLFYKGSYNSYIPFSPPKPAKPYGSLSRIIGKLTSENDDIADSTEEYTIEMKPVFEDPVLKTVIKFNYSIDSIKLGDLFTDLPEVWNIPGSNETIDSEAIGNVFLHVSANIGPYIQFNPNDPNELLSPNSEYSEYIELTYLNNRISAKELISNDPIYVRPGNVLVNINWTLYFSDGDLSTDPTVPHISVLSGTHGYVGLSCLLKGTKVRTINGFKKIEELKVGDYVISHLRKPVRIIKTDSWTVKWKQEISKGNRVYVLENLKTKTFISSYHKFMKNNKLVAACDANLRLARKEEICNDKNEYELYHIQIEDHEVNHLLVNGDNIVESWDGKYSDERVNKIAAL